MPSTSALAAGFTVTPVLSGAVNAESLATALAGEGVTVSNATITGDPNAVGSFSGGAAAVGIGSGVALSTGFLGTENSTEETCPNSLLGPNDLSSASCNNDAGGDADLDALLPAEQFTQQATVLEFDLVPTSGILSFTYVFGSEEYNEYVNSAYNDVFGLFVNGSNCALVPGSSTPVAVNNVNAGYPIGTGASNPEFYRDNDPADFTNGIAPFDTQLDGMTVPLTCTAPVESDTVNHVKLAIADVGDGSYDSAVLLEAGSFMSGNATTLSLETSASSVQYSDHVGVIAHLGGPSELPSLPVTLSLGGAGSQTVMTDANGNATASLKALKAAGSRTITASFAGAPGLLASHASTPITVVTEDCALAYTGVNDGVQGHRSVLAATLTEHDSSLGERGSHLVSFRVSHNGVHHTYTAVTNSVGRAKVQAPVAAGTWLVEPSFDGDSFYSPCTAEPAPLVVIPNGSGLKHTHLRILTAPGSVQYSDRLSVKIALVPASNALIAPSVVRRTPAPAPATPADAVASSPPPSVSGVHLVVSLGSSSVVAVTDAAGRATATLPVKDPAGKKKLHVRFAGSDVFAPSATSRVIDLAREDSVLTYTGAGSVPAGAASSLAARLGEKDGLLGDLSGRTVAFRLSDGSHHRTVKAVTDDAGRASTSVLLGAGTWSVRPTFAGDSWYLPASVHATSLVVAAPPRVGTSAPVLQPRPTPPAPDKPRTHVLGRKVTKQHSPTSGEPASGGTEAGGSDTGSPEASGGEGAAGAEHTFNQPTFVLSIPDVHQVSLGSTAVLVNGLLALLMVFMIAFPAELFNGTLKENYDEVRGWFGPLNRFLQRLESSPLAHSRLSRLAGGLAFVVATGVVYAFVEPGFRLDRASLQLVLGLTLGLVVITVLANESALLFGRLRYKQRGRLRMRPGALLVALGCVLLSRAAHFEPGYVYGLVAGFTFSRELPRRQDGRVVLAWAGWLLALGVGGWLLLAPAKGWALHHETSFWGPVVEELTAAVVVETLTILILALVPLSFLEGERIWRWHRLPWAVVYGLALFAFLHVVVHPEFGARKTELPLYTWLGFFAGFCVLSIAFWSYFRFRPRRVEHAH